LELRQYRYNLAWNYLYGLGQRMARFKGSNKQIYHNDHLGNVRAITDTAGAVIAKIDYYPFGDELSLTGSPGRFTYNGNEFDDEYGFDLYYYGARYMDPVLGRFTITDPMRADGLATSLWKIWRLSKPGKVFICRRPDKRWSIERFRY